jgi:hypothetical protein
MMRKTRVTALAIATATLWITATTAYSMDEIKCWFPPSWKVQRERALNIARVLTEKAGVSVRPRIARYYPEILAAFSAGEPALVYAGSFVQAIIHSRDFGTPLVQNSSVICSISFRPELPCQRLVEHIFSLTC